MDDQIYKNPDETSEIIGEIDRDTNPQTLKSDSFADRTPVDEALINDTPMGGTVASVEPLSGPLPDEIQMFETPNQEIPMGGTIAAVGPMDQPVGAAVLIEEVGITPPQVVVSTPDETWESKISDLNPCDDPMDEMLRQKEHVATTGGLAN